MKTVRNWIILGLTLLLLATCVTTPKYEEQVNELTRYGYFTLKEHNEKGMGPVFIFTERHDSRLIQAEIAWGLEVLREKRGINSVALEGMFIGEVMDAEKVTYETDIDKYIVALARLEHGEIKAPEMMYLAMDSFVFGMEDEKLYNIMEPAGADAALFGYLLMGIGADYGEETLEAVLEQLSTAPDDDDLEWLFSQYPLFDDTFEETYNIFTYSRSGIAITNWLAEIEEKARQFVSNLPLQIRRDFRLLKEFYGVTNQRSLTMAGHVLDIMRRKSEPLSMIIGYAHTKEVIDFFEKNNVSYYVLEPRGMYDDGFWSDLTDEEYERREEGLPFFANDQLLSFFVNEHNPRPVVDKEWSKREDNFFLLTDNMTKLAENDIDPETQDRSFFYSNGLEVSRSFLDISNPNDIKFFIENESDDRLFVRVMLNPQGNQFGSFSKALEEIIEKLFNLDELNPPLSERIKTLDGLIEVFNLGRYAVFISPSSEVWSIDPRAL